MSFLGLSSKSSKNAIVEKGRPIQSGQVLDARFAAARTSGSPSIDGYRLIVAGDAGGFLGSRSLYLAWIRRCARRR